MITNNTFYVLAFLLALVVTGFDFMVVEAPELLRPLRSTVWWVTLLGFFAYLFKDKIRNFKTKFEKGTLWTILVGVIYYKILVFVLAFIFHYGEYKLWASFINNETHDTIGLFIITFLLIVNLWVLRSSFGKSVSLSFSRLRQSLSSFLKLRKR